MATTTGLTAAQVVKSEWYKNLARFQHADVRQSVWQLVNTFVPYVGLWALMAAVVRAGGGWLWFLPPLLVVTAGLQVRLFIIFHDCTHSSFFNSAWANRLAGYVTGIINFTPFEDWRHSHLLHHATVADLERRGAGDVWTMTVDEYLAAPPLKRLTYRLFRMPFVLFVLGPTVMFLLVQRFPRKETGRRERLSVLITDVALLAIVALLSATIGLRTYLLIQLPLFALAGAAGVWLFYVQHQFEGVYWARHADRDPIRAALEGASYYRLPKVLQWFTGSIGLHHIHHLRPRIPNYYLQLCQDTTAALQQIKPLTFRASLHSLFLNLWDETHQKLVSFGSLRRLSPAAGAGRG